jgi:hypothetical protein
LVVNAFDYVKLPALKGGASRKGKYLFEIASLNPALKGGECKEANRSNLVRDMGGKSPFKSAICNKLLVCQGGKACNFVGFKLKIVHSF